MMAVLSTYILDREDEAHKPEGDATTARGTLAGHIINEKE
jgi:hypothetical protein